MNVTGRKPALSCPVGLCVSRAGAAVREDPGGLGIRGESHWKVSTRVNKRQAHKRTSLFGALLSQSPHIKSN